MSFCNWIAEWLRPDSPERPKPPHKSAQSFAAERLDLTPRVWLRTSQDAPITYKALDEMVLYEFLLLEEIVVRLDRIEKRQKGEL